MSVNSVDGPVPKEYSYEANSGVRNANKDLDKNAFLQLFIMSLKNQDPTSPQDANEFMSQMAQFSILEQLANMNTEINKLRLSQEFSQATSLIGKDVTVFFANNEFQGQVEKVNVFSGEIAVYLKNDPTGYPMQYVTEVK